MKPTTPNRGLLRFTLPEPPSANRWWRKWKNRMVLSEEARGYKAFLLLRAVVLTGRNAKTLPVFGEGSVAVTVTRLGVLLDALQGVAYRNDGQIVRLHAERTDGGSGTVTVTVEVV